VTLRRHVGCEHGTTLVEVVVAAVVLATVVASLGTASTLLQAHPPGDRGSATRTMAVASLALDLSRSLGSARDVEEATHDRLVVDLVAGRVVVRIDEDAIVVDATAAGGIVSEHLAETLASATLSYRDHRGRDIIGDDASPLVGEDLARVAFVVLDVVLVADGSHNDDGEAGPAHRLVTVLARSGAVP
jgi:hypothetical protein